MLISLALKITCKPTVLDKKSAAQNSEQLYDTRKDEMILKCRNCAHNQDSSAKPKIFLKDLLENPDEDIYEDYFERDKCKIKSMEISLNVKNCGRILLNTTKCEGYCKSKATIIPNTNFQKNLCYACKALKTEFKTYRIKCLDGTLTQLTLETVKTCTCFKHTEKINPLNQVYRKSFLENYSL